MSEYDELVPHMRRVHAAERDLRDLGVVWQMVESSAAISCPESAAAILPTLINTRQRFDSLQQRLIHQMASENHAALADELSARAQCAIDILVRNLFERTADVGFLATDDVIRDYCAAPSQDREGLRAAMVARLCDYQSKYTVYDDILLLSPRAEVLARLNGDTTPCTSSDPIVEQALKAQGHVERFAPTDLNPDPEQRAQPVLQYGHRICTAQGQVLGVLVLRFRFLDEMQRIFADMEDDHHQMALVLVGEDQRVIATNDEAHVPTGALMRRVPNAQMSLTAFAGREYLAVSCTTHGYQGYNGPGWRAQAMVSLLTAFRQRDDAQPAPANIPIENNELITICRDADAINRDLRRVVWNGRLACNEDEPDGTGRNGSDDGARLKAVLSQVNGAGSRTRARVDQATRDLYKTTLTRSRRQAADLARLAADIMDRNLYERANDCRWWALSPALQQALAAHAGPDILAEVLDHINSLYTVYSRLVVFDAGGTIRGVSRAGEMAQDVVGQAVDPQWLKSVQGLNDGQRYAVTAFTNTELHDHGDTYVFLAAIRAPGPAAPLLGGMAIVFHSAREFSAMLGEILGGRAGFAAFVDSQGRLIASSQPELTEGEAIGFSGDQAVIEHQGVHYACCRVRGKGYREFKQSDGYDNQVSAVVGLRLGAAERRRAALSDQPLLSPATSHRHATHEVAVFQVGAARYALPASALVEAVSPQGLVRTPTSHPLSLGLLEIRSQRRPRMLQVMCARRCFGVAYPSRATDGVVLVLRSPALPELPLVGLQVDDVLTVMAVQADQIHAVPQGMGAFAPWVQGMMDCDVQVGDHTEHVLVQMLDPARIATELLGPLFAGEGADAREALSFA